MLDLEIYSLGEGEPCKDDWICFRKFILMVT